MFKPKISKEEVNQLPVVLFDGKVVLVDDESKVADAIADLSQSAILGIDTETKPSFTRGQFHKISLVQVSTLTHCYLFRLNKIKFPQGLADILESKKILKIGLALRDDLSGLNKHHRFSPDNVVDLQNIVKNYGILELGLQKMFAIVFGRKISKSQRLTNWESAELTEQQKLYAATDAWSVLLIYLQLQKEKKLTKKQIEILIQEVAAAEQKPENTTVA